MQVPQHNEDRIVRRAIELAGGKETFFAATDSELKEINTRWNQNVDVIGRILRSHLFVEHYLTKYLAQANTRLGSLSKAKFSEKIDLLDAANPDIVAMLPGIKRLNVIRNRLAHDLVQCFIYIELFSKIPLQKRQMQLRGVFP